MSNRFKVIELDKYTETLKGAKPTPIERLYILKTCRNEDIMTIITRYTQPTIDECIVALQRVQNEVDFNQVAQLAAPYVLNMNTQFIEELDGNNLIWLYTLYTTKYRSSIDVDAITRLIQIKYHKSLPDSLTLIRHIIAATKTVTQEILITELDHLDITMIIPFLRELELSKVEYNTVDLTKFLCHIFLVIQYEQVLEIFKYLGSLLMLNDRVIYAALNHCNPVDILPILALCGPGIKLVRDIYELALARVIPDQRGYVLDFFTFDHIQPQTPESTGTRIDTIRGMPATYIYSEVAKWSNITTHEWTAIIQCIKPTDYFDFMTLFAAHLSDTQVEHMFETVPSSDLLPMFGLLKTFSAGIQNIVTKRSTLSVTEIVNYNTNKTRHFLNNHVESLQSVDKHTTGGKLCKTFDNVDITTIPSDWFTFIIDGSAWCMSRIDLQRSFEDTNSWMYECTDSCIKLPVVDTTVHRSMQHPDTDKYPPIMKLGTVFVPVRQVAAMLADTQMVFFVNKTSKHYDRIYSGSEYMHHDNTIKQFRNDIDVYAITSLP